MKQFSLILLIFLIVHIGIVPAYTQFTPLTGNELPGGVVISTNTYTPETLWTYNSDAAPLISEYGFTSLLVQKFTVGTEDLRLEAYLMNSPEAAYGPYSTSILGCTLQDSVTSWDCLTQYQYKAAYGRNYIIITNQSGSREAQEYSYVIMQKWMLLNPQEPLKLPDVFNAPALKDLQNQVDFVCGMLGMQNSMLGWENLIVGVRFTMYGVIVPDPNGEIYFARITFPTQEDQYNFLNHANLMQNGTPVPVYNPNGFTYREFVPPDPSDLLTIYFLQSTQPVAIAEITEN